MTLYLAMISDRTPKSTGNKRKHFKIGLYIKKKIGLYEKNCALKNMIRRVKRQIIEWKTIFANHIPQ